MLTAAMSDETHDFRTQLASVFGIATDGDTHYPTNTACWLLPVCSHYDPHSATTRATLGFGFISDGREQIAISGPRAFNSDHPTRR